MDASKDPVSGPASHGEDKALEHDQDEINQPDGGGEENKSQSNDDDENQTTQTPESSGDAPGGAENDVENLEKLLENLSLPNATSEPEGQTPTGEGWNPQASTDDHGSSDEDLHTSIFNLNDYTCDCPPRFLYRAVHPGSHSITGGDGSVIARNQSPNMKDLDDFRDTARNHFDWRLPKPSPYMSTFSTLLGVQDWANMIFYFNEDYGKGGIRLLMIDTSELSARCIFDAKQLAARLNIRTVNPSKNTVIDHIDEFLIKGCIDAKAIVAEGTLEGYDDFAKEAERILAEDEDD